MTGAHDNVVSPAIAQLLHRLCAICTKGQDAVVVGPSGIGVSTIGSLLAMALSETGVQSTSLDCRGPGSWQDAFRQVCEAVSDSPQTYKQSPVLLIDHAGDLSRNEIQDLQAQIRAWSVPGSAPTTPPSEYQGHGCKVHASWWWPPFRWMQKEKGKRPDSAFAVTDAVRFSSSVWMGQLDCRALETETGLQLASEPRGVLHLPEYHGNDLLGIYAAIGKRQESDWGEANGDADLQKSLGKHLTEYRKERAAASNLWTRVCGLHAENAEEELGAAPEPPLANIVAYMTFGELSDLLLGLDSSVFVRWESGAEQGKDSPAKRWPEYMARLRRLRNQSAHLRNVALQDIEDLLVTVRQMRRDIRDYA